MPDASSRPIDDTLRTTRLLGAITLATLVLGMTGCAHLPDWTQDTTGITTERADPAAHESAQQRLHAAVQAAQPGQAQLTRARRSLENLLADERTEARAHHPYARALLEQIRERQRLSAENERLARELCELRELEASFARRSAQTQTLEQLQRDNAELQRKLDALTDIERRLATPPAPERRP